MSRPMEPIPGTAAQAQAQAAAPPPLPPRAAAAPPLPPRAAAAPPLPPSQRAPMPTPRASQTPPPLPPKKASQESDYVDAQELDLGMPPAVQVRNEPIHEDPQKLQQQNEGIYGEVSAASRVSSADIGKANGPAPQFQASQNNGGYEIPVPLSGRKDAESNIYETPVPLAEQQASKGEQVPKAPPRRSVTNEQGKRDLYAAVDKSAAAVKPVVPALPARAYKGEENSDSGVGPSMNSEASAQGGQEADGKVGGRAQMPLPSQEQLKPRAQMPPPGGFAAKVAADRAAAGQVNGGRQ